MGGCGVIVCVGSVVKLCSNWCDCGFWCCCKGTNYCSVPSCCSFVEEFVRAIRMDGA